MMMVVVYYMKCVLVEALSNIIKYALEVYYMMMVEVYYIKFVLVDAFCISNV